MHNRLQDWIQAKKVNHTHRQLVVISGPEDWAVESAIALCETLEFDNILTVGLQADSIKTVSDIHVTNSNYRQYLGQEFSGLIYNAYQGFRANAVMALSGTITRGGLMLLLCPDLDTWADFEDQERQKRTSFGFENTASASVFISRLVNKVKQEDKVVLFTPQHFYGSRALNPEQNSLRVVNSGRTPSQEEAIQKITKVLTGHRKRPLVIEADRGRGKSSVLGMAAAELLKDQCKNIIVTAPSAKACQQTFAHAEHILNGNTRPNMVLKTNGRQLRFMPPDVILSTKPEADLLLVDEAAAIPTPLLKQMLSLYSRIVFSTTVHGYEGSGRGFEIRFKKHLDTQTPHWRSMHLKEPIRWDEGDTLESFWFNVLLMKEPENTGSLTLNIIDKSDLSFEVLQGKELCAQPKLLANLFSLMVDAHYQTVPDDLQRLLDSPDHFILIAKCNTHLVAAILFVTEPAYLGDLVDDIHQGKRRVNGHLLSQSLCFHCGLKEATKLTYLRTVRIAVNPQYQNKRIGSKLLQQLEAIAQEQQVDMLGTSFGLEKQLLNFWQKNNYQLVRIGHQKDASSGEHSGLMVLPISIEAEKLTQLAKSNFSNQFVYQLSRHFNSLPSSLIKQVLNGLNYLKLPADSLSLIKQFAFQERPLELVEHHLNAFLLHRLSQSTHQDKPLTDEELHPLISYCLQGQTIESTCTKAGLTGKKQLKAALVNAVKKLLY